MRLFLGIRAKTDFYENIKDDFCSLLKGRWVKKENLHTTLYFFGEVNDANLIKEKIKTVTFPKQKVILEGLGYFGYPPKVLFINLKNNIYKDSYLQLENLFGKTSKRFHPHITLLRIKKVVDKSFKEKIKEYKNKELGYLEKEVILFKSQLTKNGPIYTPLKYL